MTHVFVGGVSGPLGRPSGASTSFRILYIHKQHLSISSSREPPRRGRGAPSMRPPTHTHTHQPCAGARPSRLPPTRRGADGGCPSDAYVAAARALGAAPPLGLASFGGEGAPPPPPRRPCFAPAARALATGGRQSPAPLRVEQVPPDAHGWRGSPPLFRVACSVCPCAFLVGAFSQPRGAGAGSGASERLVVS